MNQPTKPSILDRAIRAVAPERALKRLEAKRQFDVLASGEFDAARNLRQRDNAAMRRAWESTEDEALKPIDRERMELNIRDVRRNLPVAFGLLNRFADGVVGTGITPVPQTKDPGWNKAAAEFYAEDEKICDYRRRLHGWEMDRLTVKARMTSGGCLFIKLDSGQLQPVEMARIRTPESQKKNEGVTVFRGFRVNKQGMLMGVYVCDRKKGGRVDLQNAEYVRHEDMIFPSIVERFDQIAGLPTLSSIYTTLKDHGELQSATLFKAKLDAFMGWAVYSDEDLQASNMGPRDETPTETNNNITVQKVDKGEVWYAGERDKIESLASKTPNPQYDKFNIGLLRMMAMAAGIPYEVMMMDMLRASFSGGHGLTMMANYTWGIWRKWLCLEKKQPHWNWRIGYAIKQKKLTPAPVDARGISEWYKVVWVPPQQMTWDPKGAATANRMRLEMGETSMSEIARARGTTSKAIFTEKADNIIEAMEEYERIKKKFKDADVSWRDIMNFSTSSTRTIAPEEPDDRGLEDKDED